MDLHFDSLFDACPICCCNVNIRAYELGLYINAFEKSEEKKQEDPKFMFDYWDGLRPSSQECNCGFRYNIIIYGYNIYFSAVRYRYLTTGYTGLFPDDITEATGQIPTYRDSGENRLSRFNPTKKSDVLFVDLLRHQSLQKDLSAMVEDFYYIKKNAENLEKVCFNKNFIIKFQPQKYGFDTRDSTDYIISTVDAQELDKIMINVVNNVLSSDSKEISIKFEQKILHPWGYQVNYL